MREMSVLIRARLLMYHDDSVTADDLINAEDHLKYAQPPSLQLLNEM